MKNTWICSFMLLFMCGSLFVAAQTQQEVWIKNGERNIYGVLSRPKSGMGDKQPVAIISHGFNGTGQFGSDYFEALNSIGYQCYTFDFPCGSVYSRSDNNTMNMSVRDQQDDLLAIIRHFKNQPDIDASGIVLIGESQGGLVSALAAGKAPKDVSQLVLIYPALCIPDNWNARYPNLTDIPDTTRLWNVPLGRRFFTEVHGMNVYKEIKKYKKPVLIIHGDMDQIVPISYSQSALKVYKNAALKTIGNAGHGFKPYERLQAIGWIKDFLLNK